MDAPLVSIIVPVYNTAAWLGACLDSIAGQSYQDLEVLLVDDGSTDGSLELCLARAAADRRFRVLTQPHAGVSAARNLALEEARGRYLQFVDGDDALPAGATEALVRAAVSTGADLVTGRFWRVCGTRRALRGHIRRDRLLTVREYAQEMVKAPANFYYGVVWNKLYRRSLVGALRFDTELNWCEDFLFNLEYLRRARLIAATARPVYCYVKRRGSLVSTQVTPGRTVAMKRTLFAAYKALYQDLGLYHGQELRVYGYLFSAALDGGSFSLPGRRRAGWETGRRRAVPRPGRQLRPDGGTAWQGPSAGP